MELQLLSPGRRPFSFGCQNKSIIRREGVIEFNKDVVSVVFNTEIAKMSSIYNLPSKDKERSNQPNKKSHNHDSIILKIKIIS